MNKTKLTILVIAISIFLIPWEKERAGASEIDSIQVLRIMPQEETAIIQAPDGKRQLIKVGDVISDVISKDEFRVQSPEAEIQSSKYKVQSAGLRVVEIAEGRIVFEERTNKGLETVIIRVEDGKQRIERIRRVGDQQPAPLRPR